MDSQIKDNNDAYATQITALVKELLASNSAKRKSRAFGDFELKLHFKDGLVTHYEALDRTVVKIN